MTDSLKEVCDYMYPPHLLDHDLDRVEALARVVRTWEAGQTVYVLGPVGQWLGIAPPSPSTPRGGYTAPAPALPDWSCGCGETLHGDEKTCWRCGAAKR